MLTLSQLTSDNPTTSLAGFSDPNNIVCPTGNEGAGSTFLLADNVAGSWSAAANFTFRPNKFRIYNTHYEGRGTKVFRFVAQPINGILNMTFVDPVTGLQSYCDARCPLSDSTTIEYQEFTFVNVIEMNAFSIDISDWYGSGGGLDGFEIFTEDIYAYAIDAFNEPSCANGTFLSSSSNVGSWVPTVIGSEPGFLAANLSGDALSSDSVTLEPQVSQLGNYSVRIYTPGCLLDSTCSSRGGVTLSVYTQADVPPTNVTIYQTNNYDKYDTLFQGVVSASSDTFRPRVVLLPMAGQSGTVNTVASRVQFLQLSAFGTSSLNGLYEYAPSSYTIEAVANTTIDAAGASLAFDASVNAILTSGSTTYVAGNFTASHISNIFMVQGSSVTPLANGGLNGQASSLLLLNQVLYIGGNFSALVNSSVSAQYVVGYNLTSNTWTALGAGVNQPVTSLFNDNNTLGVSGAFTKINAYGSHSSKSVSLTAFWDPAAMQWSTASGSVAGTIDTTTSINGSMYLTGSIRSANQVATQGIASLFSSGSTQRLSAVSVPALLPLQSTNVLEINAGTFYNSSTKSLTIVGGRFGGADSAGNSITNVAILSSNGTLTGVSSSVLSNTSAVYATHVNGQKLFLGGSISGTSGSSTFGGLAIYDLEAGVVDPTQPAALQGTDVEVHSITTRPGFAQIVVAGNFDAAGSLTCPSLCVLDIATTAWQRPAIGLTGNVSSSVWLGREILLLAGNMTLNGSTQYLATFDFSTQSFSAVTQSLLPGPAYVAVSDTNSTNSIYIAGESTTGSAYLAKWDGNSTVDLTSGLSTGSQIYDLQFVPLLKKAATSNSIMSSNRNLLVLGNLNLTGNGTVSGALFDGAAYSPYLLSNTASGQAGTIRTLFSEQLISFSSTSSGLSRGVVVVIALAIALFITCLIVACGILAALLRRRSAGYRPASQTASEKSASAIPPQSLFGEENFQSHKGGRPPKI